MSELEKIKPTSQPTRKLLEKLQLEDYLSYQEQLAKWLLNLGKEPKKAEEYSRETVKRSIYHIDSFHRFV